MESFFSFLDSHLSFCNKITTMLTFSSRLVSSCTGYKCGMLRTLDCHQRARVQQNTTTSGNAKPCCGGITLHCWQLPCKHVSQWPFTIVLCIISYSMLPARCIIIK